MVSRPFISLLLRMVCLFARGSQVTYNVAALAQHDRTINKILTDVDALEDNISIQTQLLNNQLFHTDIVHSFKCALALLTGATSQVKIMM